MEVDRISDLPSHLIDDILSRLSVRDAAKTSVLSSKWRYKWTMVPSLVLTYQSFPVSIDCQGRTMINKLVSDIDRILLLHSGPIQKFELFYSELSTNDVDRWILHLTSSIKEFALKFQYARPSYYKVPSCVFSWQNLTCLDLMSCLLRPPSTFKGFKNLKSLNLYRVTLAQDAFDNLISGSPLLERLTLYILDGASHFNINAPNLQYFHLARRFFDVTIKNTPHLTEFLVNALKNGEDFSEIYIRHHNNLVELLAQMPQIERLCIDGCALKYMVHGIIPEALPVPCVNLRHLSISLNFPSSIETSMLLCLLRSVPNLQELFITSFYEENRETSSSVWQADQWNRPFTRLRHVKFVDCCGTQAEIDFISVMLLTSPVLTQMTVILEDDAVEDWGEVSEERTSEIAKQLFTFKRASPEAQICFLVP